MQKVLVANRGEIACRIMRSCRALGLKTVAAYSEADAKALHVSQADEAQVIGPAPAKQSYLVSDYILAAAKATGADAVHPGYGFLAENSDFAKAVARAGMTWIGPTPESIDDMGDKERARLLARAAGVPVLPGSPRFAPADLSGLEREAEQVGYPLLVKAAAGGGGIGMQRVDDPGRLRGVVESTQGLAARAFGDGTVYLERLIPRARHIEIQIFGFGDGRAVHLFERECSIQRRYQKIVEETPAPGLADDRRQAMAAAAVALAAQERYRGAGTIEFVVDAKSGEFFFLEMNTRIQVEHPVTEMTTGVDLVAEQIRVAEGAPLSFGDSPPAPRGWSIEARI
ncbi:MAG: biotin carboxylase N-terminal domain-containing protein, partial [Dongiaceae bacterium]